MQAGSLLLSLAACLAVAVIGGRLTAARLADWYAPLKKPAWTPPGWLFGPVWTVLYALMGVAAWWVWRRAGFGWELALFGLQLALNLLWSVVFFGLRRPGWAAGEIVVLWLAIAATMAAFAPISLLAVALLAPYLAWVTFAALLNWAIWRLNRPPRRPRRDLPGGAEER